MREHRDEDKMARKCGRSYSKRRNSLRRRPEKIGRRFQLPRQRNWANTFQRVEKNKDPTAEKEWFPPFFSRVGGGVWR